MRALVLVFLAASLLATPADSLRGSLVPEPEPGPADSGKGYAGDWETTFGPMTLKQDGKKVEGFYVMEGVRCTLEGTVEKNKLTFTYQEPDVRGEGWFELAADGKSFKGEWRENGATNWQPWVGRRVAAVKVDSFDGLWETTFGRMRLTQKDGKVEGVYSYASESTVSGSVEGTKLTFKYKEPKIDGEGWFELSGDGRSFKGQWREKGKEAWLPWTGTRVAAQPGTVWLVVLEANWETSLAQQEYAFGAMLRAFFARSKAVQVRHRYFTDEASLRKWCREIQYLAEPAVLVVASHGSPKGAEVGGKTINPQMLAESLGHATNLKLLHFSACCMMKEQYPNKLIEHLGARATFPISGYTTEVDWAASAVIEFLYYELVLLRRIPPEAAAQQLAKMIPLSGDKDLPGVAIKSAGFKLVAPPKR
jgi:hypothetical protein